VTAAPSFADRPRAARMHLRVRPHPSARAGPRNGGCEPPKCLNFVRIRSSGHVACLVDSPGWSRWRDHRAAHVAERSPIAVAAEAASGVAVYHNQASLW